MRNGSESVRLSVDYNKKSKRWGWSLVADSIVKQRGKSFSKANSVNSGYTYTSQKKALSEAVVYCLKDNIYDFEVTVKRAEKRGRKPKAVKSSVESKESKAVPKAVLKTTSFPQND